MKNILKKMYKVVCNGKNENYGKDGEVIRISNNRFHAWKKSRNKDDIPFYPETAQKDGTDKLVIKNAKNNKFLDCY